LALPTLLYGCETRAIREHGKSRITSAEMKFMTTAKYTWQDYESNEDILAELKIKFSCERKCKRTVIYGYNTFGEWTKTDCHT